MENLKFKVGDKVRVKSLEWYNSQEKDRVGLIHFGIGFTATMSKYCGRILTIQDIYGDFYIVNEGIYNWQDWMLEDEAVTEKQEQQLNQNDMETKEMTLKEAQYYLSGTKIICATEDQSESVQKKLFECGINWRSKSEGYTLFPNRLIMFVNEKEITYGNDILKYQNDRNLVILVEDILSIKIKEEPKPKFDPNTLKPFDKVLVRDDKDGFWRCNLFSHIIEEEDYRFECILNYWNYCIPFNEETKHLLGTKEEEPEYYQVCEK